MEVFQNNYYVKYFPAFLIVYFLLTSIIYLCPSLHCYTPYRFDDAWFTSFIYHSYINDIQTDKVYGGDLDNGMGGESNYSENFIRRSTVL